MTAEDFHDALTLLPADLVAEADRRRSRDPRLVLWHRWAAMAACFMLVLSCGLLVQSWKPGKSHSDASLMAAPAAIAQDAPAEAAPAAPNEKAAGDETSLGGSMNAAGIGEESRSNTGDAGAFPSSVMDLIWVETPLKEDSSRSASGEPETALICSREMLEDYLAGRGDQNVEALEGSTEVYDETWFSTHDLLMLRLTCSEDTTVTGIREQKGHWEIDLEEPSPESPARAWHILITVEKGAIGSADDVTPIYALP